MTRKRYQGLITELMSRAFDNRVIGATRKAIRDCDLKNSGCKSYQAAWDSLLPTRKIYGMENMN